MLKQLFAPAPPEPTTLNGAAVYQEATERRMMVTPSMAAEWLERNTDNQRLSHRRATLYAREMAAGQWLPGHARIVIGRDGILCNGQHTLTAIVMSGIPAVCSILWDDALTGPRDWRGDSGRLRSNAFQAGTNPSIFGVANLAAEVIAAGQTTPSQVGRLIPEITEYHNRLSTSTARGLSVVAIRLAVVTRMKLHPVQADEIAEMYLAFVQGHYGGLTASAGKLRDNLILGRRQGASGQGVRLDTLVRGLAVFDPSRDPLSIKVLIRNMDQRVDDARRLLLMAWGDVN